MTTQGTDDHAMSDTTFSNPVIRWIDYRLPVFTLLHHELHDYPTPRNLNYLWNFGSLAGIVLVIMIATGIVLAMHYVPTFGGAFNRLALANQCCLDPVPRGDNMTTTTIIPNGRISELVRYFLRLGFLGFGGPVALVGQMERELVDERRWLTKEQMREAIAICQSLPGPLAIQVGVYVSYIRGGFWGAWAGGWAFILPNLVIVAALGALYVYLGELQPVTAIFYGVSPAVIALILHSCYRLGTLGMEDWLQWVIAAVCLAVTVILQAELALLFIGAGLVGILYYGSLFRRSPPVLSVTVSPALAQLEPTASSSILGKLLLFFLNAGSLTFGSGLVIVPLLQQGLVKQYGWLDQRQFLIEVAIGMLSPGPVVITATIV